MSQLQCSPKKRLLEETRHRVSQLQHSITQVADVKARLKDNSLLVSSTTHHSLSQQGVGVLSGHPNPQIPPFSPDSDLICFVRNFLKCNFKLIIDFSLNITPMALYMDTIPYLNN